MVLTLKLHDVHVEAMEMTWKQQGNHKICSFQAMETTWFPHKTDIISTHGNDVEMTMFPPCDVTLWKDIISTHKNNMTNFKLHSKQVTETLWFLCGYHLVSMWTPCVFHVDTTRLQCGHHMVSRWTLHGFHVDTIISNLYR